MSEQHFQAWAEAVCYQLIESVSCGIDGVCQSCGGVIERTKTAVFHCPGRRWCANHKCWASCRTSQQYCCEEGWSEELWKAVEKQEEDNQTGN